RPPPAGPAFAPLAANRPRRRCPVADRPTPKDRDARYDPAQDPPLPSADDPGGAHGKGYVAEPAPAPAVPHRDPIPLDHAAQGTGRVRKPEAARTLRGAGRTERKPHRPTDAGLG